MATTSFDTLALVAKLTAANFSQEQAEAVVRGLQDAFQQPMPDPATTDIAKTKAELIRWVAGFGFLQIMLILGILIKIAAL
jgi:hypothetical protein